MEVKRFEDVPELFKVVFIRDWSQSATGLSFDEWLEEQGFEVEQNELDSNMDSN